MNFSKDGQKKNRIYRIAIFLTGLFGVLYYLILQPGHPHDSIYWVYRIGAMAEEMQLQGIAGFPYRILSTSYEQYGYGAPLFYGDFFLIIPAVLTLLGMSSFMALQVHSAFVWCMRLYVAYFSANRIMEIDSQDKDEQQKYAMIFALLYCCFPYMLEVIIRRGSIGETQAGVFLPLVFAFLWRLLTFERNKITVKDAIGLAFGIFGVVISHVITTYLLAFFVIAIIFFQIRKIWQEKWRIWELGKAFLISVGFLAFWLFPFLEQFLEGYLPPLEEQFTHRGLTLKQWIVPCEVEFAFQKLVFHSQDSHDWYPSMVFYILVSATFLWLYVCRKEDMERKVQKTLTNILIASWLIMISISMRPALDILSYVFGVVQFPWRILGFIALMLAIVLTYQWRIIKKRKLKLFILLLYVGSGLLSIGINMINEVIDPWVLSYSSDSHYREELYIPMGSDTSTSVVRGEKIISSSPEVELNFVRNVDGSLDIEYLNNKIGTSFELPLFYYKGYCAVDQNGQNCMIYRNEQGLVEIVPNSEDGNIHVFYQGTLIQKVSNIISIIFWIGIVLLQLIRKTKIYGNKEVQKESY